MNHYNYKITNTKTGQFYIGVRSCKCAIQDDKYMGSSSVWNKDYVINHQTELKKEILEEFETRKLANGGEVKYLKLNEHNPLCVNKYFGYMPNVTGRKQTKDHINKRKRCGEQNGMYGKHHTDAAKQAISSKLIGRIISDEAKKKIGNYHRGKKYNQETRDKISKSHQKIRRIENIKTGEVVYMSLTEFNKIHPDYNTNSMRKAVECGTIYKKLYKLSNCEALISNDHCKSGEHGEPPAVDNPVGSIGSK